MVYLNTEYGVVGVPFDYIFGAICLVIMVLSIIAFGLIVALEDWYKRKMRGKNDDGKA